MVSSWASGYPPRCTPTAVVSRDRTPRAAGGWGPRWLGAGGRARAASPADWPGPAPGGGLSPALAWPGVAILAPFLLGLVVASRGAGSKESASESGAGAGSGARLRRASRGAAGLQCDEAAAQGAEAGGVARRAGSGPGLLLGRLLRRRGGQRGERRAKGRRGSGAQGKPVGSVWPPGLGSPGWKHAGGQVADGAAVPALALHHQILGSSVPPQTR